VNEKRIVRMPKSQDASNNMKYFEPRYITIQRGETIDWINDDTRDHTLLSQMFGKPTDLLRIGPIKPGETQSRQINYGISKIDYFCSIHPQEVGTIIILEKLEANLSNIERVRMLSNTFNIKPPAPLAHIDSPHSSSCHTGI
jgi:plastocyanin